MVQSGQSILVDLNLSDDDTGELQQVLGSVFHHSASDLNNSQVLWFSGDQSDHAIKLLFNAKHELKDAVAGPALTQEQLDETRIAIAEALHKTEPRIGNWILFSPLPVNGAFQYRDKFQILPVPTRAPKSNAILADHPFLLQFRYDGSSNQLIDIRRRCSQGRALEFLLASLLHGRICHQQGFRSAWVIDPDSIGIAPPSAMCWQLGYTYSGHKETLDEFTQIEGLPTLRMIDGREFLSRIGSQQMLDLPDYFERLTTAYVALDAPNQLKFWNAGHWIQHAARTHLSSRSASYVALALAIESLMPPPEGGEVCDHCNRTIGKGPTQRFKEFVARFVPDTKDFRQQTDHLYRTRSKLAHGGPLLISDRDQLMAHSLASFEERRESDYLYSVARYAVVNWLNDQPRQ